MSKKNYHVITKPHYPQIVLSFADRNYKVEIDRDELDEGYCVYAAWVNHDRSYVVAVPCAMTTIAAISQAKQWIDQTKICLV